MSAIRDFTVYESPIGPLTLAAGEGGLSGLYFPGRAPALPPQTSGRSPALAEATGQLEEYFAGERQLFELRLDLQGTAFQQSVWDQLLSIPFGETISYKRLAERLGRLDRVRAVGGAVGRTPVPIIVPCHRAVGSDGSLTGYGGGLQRKQALLDLESRVAAGRPPDAAWAFRQLALT
jgi:methylated-DNA-[protein]-cysteine S-methyltransferase